MGYKHPELGPVVLNGPKAPLISFGGWGNGSNTWGPRKIYGVLVGLRKILPPERGVYEYKTQ